MPMNRKWERCAGIAAQHFADYRCRSNIASDKGCVEITALVMFGNTETYCRNICFTLRTGDRMSRYTWGNTAGAFSSSEFIIELLMNVRFHFFFFVLTWYWNRHARLKHIDVSWTPLLGRGRETSTRCACRRRMQDVLSSSSGDYTEKHPPFSIEIVELKSGMTGRRGNGWHAGKDGIIKQLTCKNRGRLRYWTSRGQCGLRRTIRGQNKECRTKCAVVSENKKKTIVSCMPWWQFVTLYVSLALLEICWPLLDAALVAANVGKVRVKTSIHVFSQDIMPLHSVQNDAEVGRGNRLCFFVF